MATSRSMPTGSKPSRDSRHFHEKRWAKRAIDTLSPPNSLTIMRLPVQVASTTSNFSDPVWMSQDTESKRQRNGGKEAVFPERGQYRQWEWLQRRYPSAGR